MEKVKWYHVSLLMICLTLSGCGVVQTKTLIPQTVSAPKGVSLIQGETQQGVVLTERMKNLEILHNNYNTCKKSSSDKLKALDKEANKVSIVKLGISASGIMSAVVAAVLVVASPANAAAVAGLSAYSAAVTGYVSDIGREGYTRDALIAYQTDAIDNSDQLDKSIDLGGLGSLITSPDEKWQEALSRNYQNIERLCYVTEFTKRKSSNTQTFNIITNSLPFGTVKTDYNYSIRATGGAGPYNWSRISGALPEGLDMSSTGVISGLPKKAGNFNFTVQAMESGGAIRTMPLDLAIKLNVTNVDQSCMVGIKCDVQLSADGGTAPLTWTVDGNLPKGMSFSNGALTGTPSVANTFSLELHVTDANGSTGVKPITLQVK
jgi:hypothetical protein